VATVGNGNVDKDWEGAGRRPRWGPYDGGGSARERWEKADVVDANGTTAVASDGPIDDDVDTSESSAIAWRREVFMGGDGIPATISIEERGE
jgi:hypothetical protein